MLQDYERYKELQKLERQAEEEERIANFKKKAFTADPEVSSYFLTYTVIP